MRGSAALRTTVTPGGALAGPWVRNPLWTAARAVPSLDLRFAENKSLTDAATGQNLVTFTRASSGTYVDSQGVIRTATTNLLLRSEEFETTWVPTNATVTANQTIAPNGTLTADQFVENVAGTARLAQNVAVTPGVSYTASIYLKAGTNSIINWREDAEDVYGIQINLATGSITNGTGTIVPVGNGWYRVSFTGSVSGTTFKSEIRAANSPGTIFLWGAQLEASSAVGEYVPTTSTINSAPRFDHNPTTGESLGLLVEESRTNLVRNNTMVGAVAGSPGTPPTNGWVIVNTATYASSIIGTGIENGINYIDIQYVIAAGAAAATLVYADTPAATGSTTYTGSYYLKLVSGSIPQVRFIWQDNVSTYNRSFFDITNTFTRYNDVLTTASTGSLARLAIGINASAGGTTFAIRVGMPQIEQGAFATSVIPTTTATATRSADVASITGSNFSSWYRQDEGTVFSDCVGTHSASQVLVNIGATAAVAGVSSTAIASNLTSSQKRVRVRDAAAADQASLALGAASSGSRTRIAAAIKADDFAASLDGGTALTDATGTVPTVALMEIGSAPSGVTLGIQLHRRLTFWPQRLSNSTLQALTQ